MWLILIFLRIFYVHNYGLQINTILFPQSENLLFFLLHWISAVQPCLEVV